MVDAHKNFAYSLVATAPSPATTGTSLVVTAGEGTLFPAVPFNAVIWPAGAAPTSTNAEIVRVTGIATDTFTITRTQESTSARTVVVGDQIAAAITALTLTDAEGSPALATPAIVLGSTAAAGAAATVIRSDSTIAAFDAVAPSTQAFADAAAVGTAAFAARRDHKHAMPAIATAATQEAGTDAVNPVVASVQHRHPSAAKFWVVWTGNSTTILASYNMTSIADTGPGDADGTIATDFSSASWCGVMQILDTSSGWVATTTTGAGFDARAAGTFGVTCAGVVDGGTVNVSEPDEWMVMGFGDHA